MAEKPPEMLRNNRPKVDIQPGERLYRRVNPADWASRTRRSMPSTFRTCP